MFSRLLLILLITTTLFGKVTISNDKELYDDFTIEYIYDKTEKFTIDDIKEKTFLNATSNSFTFGYIDGVTWFKLEVQNLSDKENYILSFNEAIWETFDFYYLQEGIYKKEPNGLSTPLSKRSISDVNPSFNLYIAKNSTQTFYIKGQTIASQIGSIKIFTAEEYYKPSKITLTHFYIIITFIFMVIVLLNLYSYSLTRDDVYLFYIVYILSSILFLSMHSGSYLILGLDGWSEGLHVVGALLIMFLLLFTDKFLNFKTRLPLIHKFFMFSALIFLIFATLIYFNIPYSSGLSNIYASLFFMVLIFAVIKVFAQGYATAKYYLIGLLIYATLMALMIATFNTFLDYSTFTRHAFLLGSLIEIIFFTLILTSKYRSISLEKIRIQKELIIEKDINKESLELEITKRTKEIALQNKKFKMIYNTSQDGLILLDRETTKYIEVNEAFCKKTGYTEEELLNKTCFEMTAIEDRENSQIAMEKVIENGCITDFEKQCVRKDGTSFHVSISTTMMDDKKTMLASIKDISKHKQLVDSLKSSQLELKYLASTDPMTGLYNRRYFMEMSESIYNLAKRNDSAISTIMLDIDKFKDVNDKHGHDVGDSAIISLAKILQNEGRKSDIVSRWGGEEFLILLPETTLDGALIISEKIRQTVEEAKLLIEDHKILRFTVSVGVSQVKIDEDKDIEASISRADKALYEAKESGRNRVCPS